MWLSKISDFDRGIIFECLTAAARGPFFTDADIAALFGSDRSELIRIVACIPQLDDSKPNVSRAVGASLLNLLSYPHGKEVEWFNWFSVSRSVVAEVDARWIALLAPLSFDSFKVFGPACLGRKYYRVVEYRIRGAGTGWDCQVWASGQWLCPRDGPGGNAIIRAVPALPDELQRAGVDCSPLPDNYDPLKVECERIPE